MDLKTRYESLCNRKSDINEHLPVLKALASVSSSVCELGVRGVVSSYALLYGLSDSSVTGTKSMLMNDIVSINTDEISNVATQVNVDLKFVQGDDLKIPLSESFDMTFIDTWHVYGQLKRELERYKSHTNKIIAMHDTTVDGEVGETIRNGWNAVEQSKSTGYPIEEINKGLWPAVEEFLEANQDWKLIHRFVNNNGLTVLSKAECFDEVLGVVGKFIK